jgi:hemerythrin-like domain-containing protein
MEKVIDPISVLKDEHKKGMYYLAKLDNAADYIRINGFSAEAFEQIVEATQYINTELRQHNESEEKYLFPLIERHASGPSHLFRDEHKELWKHFHELEIAIKDVEEGHIHGSSIKELVEIAKAVVDLMGSHISKENDILFPLAKQLLSQEEYSKLSNGIIR